MPKKATPPQEATEQVQAQSPDQAPETVASDVQASPEAPTSEAKPDGPISFAEPVSAADLTAGVSDNAHDAVISAEQLAELQRLAEHDNVKRDFTLKVLEARRQQNVEPAAPPPIPDRVRQQTDDEMAAGRKMNEHYAALHARHHPHRAPEPEQAKAVFRPADYVPDQKKGQGNVQARNL